MVYCEVFDPKQLAPPKGRADPPLYFNVDFYDDSGGRPRRLLTVKGVRVLTGKIQPPAAATKRGYLELVQWGSCTEEIAQALAETDWPIIYREVQWPDYVMKLRSASFVTEPGH